MNKRLILPILLLASLGIATPLSASPIDPVVLVGGPLTATIVNDPTTLAFLAFDVRGSVGLSTALGGLQVITLGSPPFGNNQLVGLNFPDDGSAIVLTFNPLTLRFGPGFTFLIDTTGELAVGPASAVESAFLPPATFQFTVTAASVDPPTGNFVFQGDLTAVTQAAPEPAELILFGPALGALFVLHRRRTLRRAGSPT